MEDSGRRGRDKYEREGESSDRRRGSEWREREQPRKRVDDDDGRRNVRRRDRSNHGTGSESSDEDRGYSSDSDGRRRSIRRNSGRRGQEKEQDRKRLGAKDRNERQETDSDGKRIYSSDSDDRRRNNRRASERNERESDREKKRSEGRWQEDEQNRKRLDVRGRNERQESGSDGKGSYSSDSDNRRRTNRRASERDGRESDRERIGSERWGLQHKKRLDARYRNGRRSESSSDDGSYSSDSDSRCRTNRSTRERNQRERSRERQEQGQEKHRKNLQEAEDSNRKTREDVRDKNGHRHDLESSGDERDKRSELQQSRKRMDEEKDSQQGFREGRDDMKEGNRENDLENSSEERDEKRSERQEQEQPRKRLEEDGDDMHRNKKDKKKNGRLENDSESSDEEQEKKRSERKKMEQSRKRLDEDEKDTKEPVIEGRHGKRRDERSRKNVRRGSDSESSGGESRRCDKDGHRRERERRRRRYDSDDSLDSDGRRRRHSTRRKNEQRDDKVMKQRHDLEDVDVRSMRERGEKASELKQVARDGKREEATKPQIQSTEANANPGGDLATLGRTGGVYIPPFKLARMMKEIEDKSSVEYQRLTWDALRKSINGLVNKVNATNIKNIIPELFSENLIRGRGLFCRSCMKSQMASPGFTDVFAALVAVVNTKFPEVGDLLLRRIVLQLKRAYKRNDKPQLIAAVKFIAHLVNQQVAHELVALELLTILLEQPTDDSVEVAVDFVKECGSILQDLCPKGLHGIFERFRGILHEGEIDKRVQFLIEGLFAIRKAKFQGHPAVRPELDLVEPEEQLTHEISLEDEIDPEIGLDIFRHDPNFADNEKRYEELKKSILGDDSEDEDGSDAESDDDDDDDEDDEDDEEEQMQIKDETETNLVNLRRTIYLTIMSSVDFEEAGHKLLKIKLEPGQEMELCIMLLECCSQERTYLRYYGLLGQRFCMLNKVYQENFEKCFVQQYSMIHRLETNKLRNVAKFFAHLLGTDALPWHVLAYIRLTEEDTTSSSRIFIKILFQELSEHLGIRLLNERLNDPAMGDSFESIFPKDNPRNTRFSINFFTSIGLGGITENLREYLKNMPRMIMQQQKPESEDESGSGSGSGSDSSSSESGSSSEDSENSSSSDESSDSDDDRRRKRKNDGGSGRDRGRDRKRRKKT